MSENKNVNRVFLGTVLLYVGVSLGLSLLAAFVPQYAGMSSYASILLSQLLVFLPAFFYCRRRGGRVRDYVPYRKINIATIVLVVICTYLMYPLIIVLNAISMIFTTSGSMAVMDMMQGQSFFLSLLFTAILPACVEEFLFRGVLFSTYKKSRMLPAIFLSGFLFGCMHMNLNQFMYAFALGVYLAFLVEATGSIFSSMLAHFTLNFTSVVLSFLLPFLYEILGMPAEAADQQVELGGLASNMAGGELAVFLMGILMWAALAVGSTAAAFGLYVAISKINGRWAYVKGMFKRGTGERLVTVPLALGLLVSFAFMGLSIYLEHIG